MEWLLMKDRRLRLLILYFRNLYIFSNMVNDKLSEFRNNFILAEQNGF